MTLKTSLMAFGTLSVLACSTAAMAQAAAPAPVTHGPVPAGLCILSSDRAVATSAVGKAYLARMQTIAQTVQAELTTEGTALQNEAKAIDAGRATMDQSTFERRAADLQVRQSALQRKAQLRQRELEATQGRQLERISKELDPAARAVYQQRACGVLFASDAIQLANPSADITDQVVQVLNTRIQTITFDRERLDQPATVPTAAPAAAPPAAPRR
jgi:Skp family chaperone for outer membrane proteins